MQTQNECDVCGRTAKYHDTSVDEGVTERHLCGVHGRRLFLGAMKDVLASQVKQMPTSWRSTDDSDAQLRERIAGASSLADIGDLFQMEEVAASFRSDDDGRG